MSVGLTKYRAASVAEMWTLSYPLMLSSMSGALMIFFDRLFLANYNTISMNSVIAVAMFVHVFYAGAASIAAIAEVLVGKYNGSNEYHKIGPAVWQMLWFAIFSIIIFIPVGLLANKVIIANPAYLAEGSSFFSILMFSGPIYTMFIALTSFYVGQGKVKLVTIVAILGNGMNLLLDYLLIFGVGDMVPAMGAVGAAIATLIAQLLQALILLITFLNSNNNNLYHTRSYSFNWNIFKKCLLIGVPNAIAHMIELLGWGVKFIILSIAGDLYVTVAGIGQSIFGLVVFCADGIQKAVIASISNYLGAGKLQLINKVIKSAIILIAMMTICLTVPLLLYPELLINGFLRNETLPESYEILTIYTTDVLFWVLIYFFLDGVVWVFAGVLTAKGHTKFIMVINAVNTWIFAIIPIYIFTLIFSDPSPIIPWRIINVYAIANLICLLWHHWHYESTTNLKLT